MDLTTILPLSRIRQFLDNIDNLDYSMIVVDEVHYFKNSHSRRYSYLRELLDKTKCDKKVFMSATPVNNSGNDYYSIKSLFGCEPERTNTTKKQAYIKLPKRNIEDVNVDLTNEEQEFYNTTDALDPFSGTVYRHIGSSCIYALNKYALAGKDAPTATKAELRDAMECLMGDMENRTDDYSYLGILKGMHVPTADSKLKRLIEIVDGLQSGTKIVIFSHYIETVKYLYSELKSTSRVGYIYANNLSDNIICQNRKNKFEDAKKWFSEENEGTTILICSDSCKEGIDLQMASALVNYDLPFNPSILEQRIGRIDRKGQKSDMKILNFHVKNTYDDRLHFILESKLRFIDYFAEYGIGNSLDIVEKNGSVFKDFIAYFEKKLTNNSYARMSNDDYSVASKVLRKSGIKVNIPERFGAADAQKYILNMLKENTDSISEWFGKDDNPNYTEEELINQKNHLNWVLNFPLKEGVEISIPDDVVLNIVNKSNEDGYFRSRISTLISNYSDKLATMEITGEPMPLSSADIIKKCYANGGDEGGIFLPKTVIDMLKREGVIVNEAEH